MIEVDGSALLVPSYVHDDDSHAHVGGDPYCRIGVVVKALT
jgi:hypothetical protein